MPRTGSDDAVLAPWAVAAGDFPADGSPEDQLRFLVRYAILAPSGHNTQPWLFRIAGAAIELSADRTRALPVVDPDDRELVMSCGAALATLRVALRHFGLRSTVELLPDGGAEGVLARVSLDGQEHAKRDEEELFAAIRHRHSVRQAFDEREITEELAGRLVADAEAEGAWLHLVRGGEREAVADLVAAGDRTQMADPSFRRELAAWVHPNRSRSADGMRGYGFGAGELASHAGPLVIRSFDLGRGQAARDRQLAQGSPLLAVLGTAEDEPASWLRGGQALQRVLLRACAHDVRSSHLNQPVEVAELRPQLARIIGRVGAFPQLLLRFGYAPSAHAQPRRPVEAVTLDTVRR